MPRKRRDEPHEARLALPRRRRARPDQGRRLPWNHGGVCGQEVNSECRRYDIRAKMRALTDIGAAGIDRINGREHYAS